MEAQRGEAMCPRSHSSGLQTGVLARVWVLNPPYPTVVTPPPVRKVLGEPRILEYSRTRLSLSLNFEEIIHSPDSKR